MTSKGKLLSKDDDGDPLAVSSSKQYEIKKSVENYLTQKAQGMLDNVLGYGNSIIEINADLNFDQVEKTMESYDPNSQVAISEQNVKSENNGRNVSDSTAQISQNSTTNYEINKTIEKVIAGSGNIKRLSVAVVVNDRSIETKKGDKVVNTSQPRPKEQMDKLEEIVKNSVGVDPTRSDQVSIVNIPFETKDADGEKITEPGMFDDMNKLVNPFLMVVV